VTRRPTITSTANDRLKAVRRLARRGRDAQVFLVEGHRQVRRALDAGVPLRELYVAPELFLGPDDVELVVLAEAAGTSIVELGRVAFASISRNARPDGLVAVAERWSTAVDELVLSDTPLVLVAEGVERPGNLGTMVRSGCSAGADALVVCDGRTDVFHPDTVRGSVGTLFHVAVAACSSAEALGWLGRHGTSIVAATPEARLSPWDVDLARPTAIVVGSERHGLSPLWLDAADAVVAIPMPGPADSLNVAVAAGVVLFEAVRQRLLPVTDRLPEPAAGRRTTTSRLPSPLRA
jgi:RNA methyltransferase, TrmH family